MSKLTQPALRASLGACLLLVTLSACAAREQIPDGEPTAERSMARQVAQDASWRIVLVNHTPQTLKYSYKRYLPPEAAQAQQRQIPQDPYANPQLASTLAISFSDDELAPGATALLEVIPRTSMTLTYLRAGSQQQEKRELEGPQQLSVSEQGVSRSELPPAYR